MEISERFIKLSSRLPFNSDVELGQDLEVLIEGKSSIANCVKVEEEDNQDGTKNKIFKLKFVAE